MDEEDGMEQNGDKNDEGTFSHFSRNHYVDTRLLDTGRRGPEDNGRLVSRQIDPVEDTPLPSSDKLGNISVRVTPPGLLSQQTRRLGDQQEHEAHYHT